MPPKSKLKSEDVPAILSEQPMSTDLMIRVCELLTKFTHTKTICLEGILPKNMRFGRKRHICLLLNSQNRWICCFNDGRKTLTEYNTNEQTDTTELSTRLLRTYNIQPFELKQSIVKSDMPSPSSDADSGFVSVAIAAKVGTRKGSPPASVDPVAVRKGLLKMMYRGKLNGFPDYEEKKGCCGKSKMLPDELLFNNLFEAFETLNRNTQMPEECPATPVPPTTPRKARVSQPKVEIQEIQEEEEEEEEQRQMKDVKISEPKVSVLFLLPFLIF